MATEEWRDVLGYEGIYQVSNFGRVKSLVRHDRLGRCFRSKLLTPIEHKNGYLVVSLYKGCKQKIKSIHRIVGEAFVQNPLLKKCIDHIDGDKKNNASSNLRWCSHKENYHNPVTKTKRLSMQSKDKKPIVCIELSRIFLSVIEASKTLSICRAGISQALIGNSKTSGGYHWRYATEEEIKRATHGLWD